LETATGYIYSRLYGLALDVLAAPASQAYVERMFSLTGFLSAGQRNRLQKNLPELRAFLKMNRKFM
jgi:type VI protein secretion system component VasA